MKFKSSIMVNFLEKIKQGSSSAEIEEIAKQARKEKGEFIAIKMAQGWTKRVFTVQEHIDEYGDPCAKLTDIYLFRPGLPVPDLRWEYSDFDDADEFYDWFRTLNDDDFIQVS